MNKQEFKDRIRELVETYRKAGPLFLVFHDSSGDLKSASHPSLYRLRHILNHFAHITGT